MCDGMDRYCVMIGYVVDCVLCFCVWNELYLVG